jgi:hypothetical protein
LGKDLVQKYYEWQMIGPHDCYAIGAFINHDLLGYCFAGTFNGSLSGFLSVNKVSLIKSFFLHPWLIANPIIINRIKIAIKIIARKRYQSIETYSIPKKHLVFSPSLSIHEDKA